MPSRSNSAEMLIVLSMLLGACTGVPSATVPVVTQAVATSAPAAIEAPGSTEAPPLTGTAAVGATTPASAGEATAPAPASAADLPSAEPPATTAAEAPATVAPVATTAPEPTMLPAPTAPAETQVAPSIACTLGALTPEQTEGPYYKANPPEASTLLQPGMNGTRVTISGYVLDPQCKPIPGARVDFWQADSVGQYDNQGYTLRGYQMTDAEGRYMFESVVPGLYPGRTRHIHVKITPPGGQTLTTQLYFPGEAANERDNIFNPKLVVNLEQSGDRESGTFNFVVQTQ